MSSAEAHRVAGNLVAIKAPSLENSPSRRSDAPPAYIAAVSKRVTPP
jgi:hypothetical protein